MKKPETIDETIAQEFIKDSSSLGFMPFDKAKEITDEAAEILAESEEYLDLPKLTSLSDAAAESLSRHKGDLGLTGLTSICDAATESLSKVKGALYLSGLTSISDAGAESLSKHQGYLSLTGLTSLTDVAAESLSRHVGGLERGLKVKVVAKRLLEEWRSDYGRGLEFELEIICSEKDLDTEADQKFTIHVNMTSDMEEFSLTPEPEGSWKKALSELLEYDLLQSGFDSYGDIGVGGVYQAIIVEE